MLKLKLEGKKLDIYLKGKEKERSFEVGTSEERWKAQRERREEEWFAGESGGDWVEWDLCRVPMRKYWLYIVPNFFIILKFYECIMKKFPCKPQTRVLNLAKESL